MYTNLLNIYTKSELTFQLIAFISLTFVYLYYMLFLQPNENIDCITKRMIFRKEVNNFFIYINGVFP